MASSNRFLLAGVLGESHCDLQAERHSAVASGTSTIKPAYRDSFPVRCLAWKEQRRPFAASHKRVWSGSIWVCGSAKEKTSWLTPDDLFPQVSRILGRVNF